MRRLFLHLARAIIRPIHHVFITATAVVDRPTDRTFIIFRYTDATPDKVFRYVGVLEGEALHSRLDLLIDEHYEDALSSSIHVVTYDGSGEYDEERINFSMA